MDKLEYRVLRSFVDKIKPSALDYIVLQWS